jgi:hypothetical protein
MKRYTFSPEDREKGHRSRADRFSESSEAQKMRRQAERALLNRVLAEAAMPEWYPHQ